MSRSPNLVARRRLCRFRTQGCQKTSVPASTYTIRCNRSSAARRARWTVGLVPAGRPHPFVDLKLQTGDLVRVKTHQEILTTLDKRNKNRGLSFDVEMVPFCGHVYRVRTRVDRFIDEKTGRMMSLKTPAVILEGVFCQSRFSKRRMFCPRGLHSWWREVWLERVSRADIGDADLMPCMTIKAQAERLEGARTGSEAHVRAAVLTGNGTPYGQ